MADTEARIGHGITFEMADLATPTVFTYLFEIFDIEFPAEATDTVDASHMASPNKTMEFITAMTDPGAASFSMNYVPGSASDKALIAAKNKKKRCRATFPNGVQWLFTGLRQTYAVTAPTNEKMEASVEWKVSGQNILTDPTAPRAIVTPLIVGTAQVGVPLELDPGIWAGADEYEFQWKVAGTDVVGATGLSYVPVTGDIGDPVTCEVTGINDDFDTVVVSAATANVIA